MKTYILKQTCFVCIYTFSYARGVKWLNILPNIDRTNYNIGSNAGQF